MLICKTFTFDAAHHLPSLPPEHKCHRMHGHTYRVEIVLESHRELDQHGMVIDYAVIAEDWQRIHDQLDHRVLNEVMDDPPTTEILVRWITRQWLLTAKSTAMTRQIDNHGIMAKVEVAFLRRVRVYESATTWAEEDV